TELPHASRPSAALCWNDMTAYDLVAHCKRSGVAVPGDLAVVGFDGFPMPFDGVWRLTSIRAPWPRVAHAAVELLLASLRGEEISQETVLPVEFVLGDST